MLSQMKFVTMVFVISAEFIFVFVVIVIYELCVLSH